MTRTISSHAGAASPGPVPIPAPRRCARRRRAALAMAMAMAAALTAGAASAQSRAEALASRLGLVWPGPEGKSPGDLAALPGFQRRGNTFVGELRTRDGLIVRLVFDARSQTLIGLRLVEPNDVQPADSVPTSACTNSSAAAPLPAAVKPAN